MMTLMDKDYKMHNIVIEYQVRGLDGTKYPSVGFTQDFYYSESDWNNLHAGVEDEIPNTMFYDEGINKSTGTEILVTYRNALIRTEKSIDYWIKVLDAVSYDQ
jgi:hypothetical protein